MSSDDFSDPESEETSEVEVKTPAKGKKVEMGDYEQQRMKRMEENKLRMEALGLHKIASSLMGPSSNKNITNKRQPKGKRKDDDDEDYVPHQQQDDDDDDDDDDEDDESSRSRTNKAKKRTSTPSKKVHVQKVSSSKNILDDDDALKQAIALSLQDSAAHVKIDNVSEKKGNAGIQESTGKGKRKKSISSRVQMTEDELILHFYQIDEAGKGNITLRDLQRVAALHDFTWSDSELADMIYFFDNNGNGKISPYNFRQIVGRCKMIQESGNAAMGS